MVPLKLKKIFILCAQRDGWETQLARVCLRKRRVAPSAFPVLSLSTFQPIILQGKKCSERHRFKAHTATYAFPCQQSGLTRTLISLRILIPTDFFSTTWSRGFCYFITHSVFALPIVECYHMLNDEIWQSSLFTVNAEGWFTIWQQHRYASD